MTASPLTTTVQEQAAPRSWSYVAWWVGLLLLHVVNTLFYVGMTIFYRLVYTTNLGFQLLTYSIGIEYTQYGYLAALHAGIATVHVTYVLVMVTSSILARRLQFSPSMPVHTLVLRLWVRLRQCWHPRAQSRRGSSSRVASVSNVAIETISKSASFVFGREGLLGVDSVHFDDLLVIRELVETLLQSYQAYRVSQVLPRLNLIRMYVALLVANCGSVPFLYRVYRERALKRRMLSLLCDAVLDMLSSMGITMLVFASYASQYNDPEFGFPLMNWFNDEWFTGVVQEFQMMLVVSWGDMASRMVFAFGLLQCIDSVKDIVGQEPPTQIQREALRQVAPTVQGKGLKLVLPAQDTQPTSQSPSWIQAMHRHLHRVAPRCFMLWGCAVIIIHIYAESNTSNWPCKLPLRPWLTFKPACSLVQIDCHALGLSGAAASLGSSWTRFKPSLVAHLTIRHCPELSIPSEFQQFNRLTSMKVYNSTITSWPTSAAITSQAHATLRALYFIRTEFPEGTLPPGLLTMDFPQTFSSFVASSTNLHSLPDDLHLVWPSRLAIALEGSQFTSVPDTVKHLQPVLFSLAANPLRSVPASLFEIPYLETLLLSYTPLQELPREVHSPSRSIYLVFLDDTKITTLWRWMEPIIAHALVFDKRLFSAQGSRFCVERNEIEAGSRTHFSAADTNPLTSLASVMDVSTPGRLSFSKRAVTCDSSFGPYFPLALEDVVSSMIT